MMDNKFGDLLSSLRKEKGLTQKDLADELNISDKAISRWETGNSYPNLDMIFRISKFFNVSFNDLLTVRVENNKDDDDEIKDIINEFAKMNNKVVKRIKIGLIVTIVIILILTVAIIFTNTYNRFKVYKVTFENKDFVYAIGMYVETNIKDTLYLSNIKIRDLDVKETDVVSVDLYYVKDNKEHIIYSSNSLKNFVYDSFQSYIKIDNLSEYDDSLYLRVNIIDSKNNIQNYNTKIHFVLDFSNNKIFNENDSIKNNSSNKLNDNIVDILKENGYEETGNNIYIKTEKNYIAYYFADLEKVNYNYEKNKYSYRYSYKIDTETLKVSVFNDHNIEIENYTYDVINDKITECIIGKCNNYKEVLKILKRDVPYFFV